MAKKNKFWKYTLIGLKGMVATMAGSIVTWLALILVSLILGFSGAMELIEVKFTVALMIIVIAFSISLSINGYFLNKFWGWK